MRDEDNVYTVKGHMVHKTLEVLMTLAQKGVNYAVEEIFNSVWDKTNRIYPHLLAQLDKTALLNTVYVVQKDFRLEGDIVGLEKRLVLLIDKDTDNAIYVSDKEDVPQDCSDCFVVVGYMDLLTQNEDGIQIVDWKTGKKKSKAYHEKDLQYKVYSTGAMLMYPEYNHNKITFAYINEKRIAPETLEVKATSLTKNIGEMRKTCKAIERDRQFKPKDGWLCDWCNHRPYCNEVTNDIKQCKDKAVIRKKVDYMRRNLGV